MRQVLAHYLLNTDDVVGDWERVKVTVGPDHEILILSANRPRLPSLPTPERPALYRIQERGDEGWITVMVEEPEGRHDLVQPLTNRRWLLCGDNRAVIIGEDGRLLRSFPVGKCLSDAQVTRSDEIWISYGDEANGRGLDGYDALGNQVFQYWDLPVDTLPPMFRQMWDCYAVNVDEEDRVWICFYVDFPVVRFKNRQMDRFWEPTPIKGAHAMAVLDDRVLFGSPYRRKDVLSLVNLNTREVEEAVPVDGRGNPVLGITHTEHHDPESETRTWERANYQAFARGSRMYVLTDSNGLYVIDLHDV